MQLTYGGFPTWIASDGGAAVVVSPVLDEPSGPWSIYPPRRIEAELPSVEAIVVLEGGIPYLDTSSIARFATEIPVYVGPLVGAWAVAELEAIGRRVVRLAWGEVLPVGRIELRLLGAIGADGSLRQQVLLQCPGEPAMLIAGNTTLSEHGEALVAEIEELGLVAVGDVASLTPPRRLGSDWDDLELEVAPVAALRWRSSLETIAQLLRQLPGTPRLAVFGGALMREYPELEPTPGCREDVLLETLHELGPKLDCVALEVGDLLSSSTPSVERAPGISAVPELAAAYRTRQRHFWAAPRPVTVEASQRRQLVGDQLERVEAALARMVLPLMMAPIGEAAMSLPDAGLGSARIGVSLFDPDGGPPQRWALDFNRAAFVRVPAGEELAVPYQLEMFAGDFLAVLDSPERLDELVGMGMRAWYPDHPRNSMVNFLLQYFGRRPTGCAWA